MPAKIANWLKSRVARGTSGGKSRNSQKKETNIQAKRKANPIRPNNSTADISSALLALFIFSSPARLICVVPIAMLPPWYVGKPT